MNELLVCVAIVLCASSGFFSLLAGGARPRGDGLFACQMGLATGLGLVASVRGILGIATAPLIGRWWVPGGLFHVHVDALAGVFLASIFLLGGLTAWYGVGYYPAKYKGKRAVRLRIYFGLIVAGMALLVVAKNSLLFLVGWETMALSAFMALSIEDQEEPVRSAGLVYLVATRLGTLAIIAMFALLRVQTGSYSLVISGLRADTGLASAGFLLALLGFGLKAGMMPLHVWLPAAHANAPTHVSALMSGVLIKMGIYGLFRLTSFYGVIPLWWGTVVLVLALSSALLGVAFALGQHDLKRLLAYHSVENIGIILLGIAIGLIGRAVSAPYLVVMGYGGALLHVINHGLFKSLLFMGAGSVIETMHTRNLELMGALSRRLPHTATAFLIGSIAISGLPPLNGFVSELYLYIGMLKAQSLPIGMSAIAIGVAVPILAMVGALALGCFVKVYAVVFLGTARSPRCEIAAEGSWSMRLPQYVLAVACVVIGLFPRAPLTALGQAIGELGERTKYVVPSELTTLSYLNLALLVLLVVGFFAFRRRGIATATVPTWDCGYVAPAARMQYSASSIAADMVDLFAALLRPRIKPAAIDGVWPKRTRFESHVPEVVLELAVLPVLRGIVRAAGCVKFIQRGTAHIYLLYVLLTLLIMLAVWR